MKVIAPKAASVAGNEEMMIYLLIFNAILSTRDHNNQISEIRTTRSSMSIIGVAMCVIHTGVLFPSHLVVKLPTFDSIIWWKGNGNLGLNLV